MASSEDTEITLGTGKLLVLFFGLVGVCALFFALGYSLGRKSEPAITTASAAIPQTHFRRRQGDIRLRRHAADDVLQVGGAERREPAVDAGGDRRRPIRLPRPDGSPTRQQTPAANPSDPTTTLADWRILRAGGRSQQTGRRRFAGGRAQEETISRVCGALSADKLFRVQVGPLPTSKTPRRCARSLIRTGTARL